MPPRKVPPNTRATGSQHSFSWQPTEDTFYVDASAVRGSQREIVRSNIGEFQSAEAIVDLTKRMF